MELLEQYQQLHRDGHFRAWAARPFLGQLRAVVAETEALRILDYGCGGWSRVDDYREALPHCSVSLYEPAVLGMHAKPPWTFDGVVCTDVLEHVPEAELPAVFEDLTRYGKSFVFVSVCCRLAKRKLPDGRNAHVTLRPMEWWRHELESRMRPDCRLIIVETP